MTLGTVLNADAIFLTIYELISCESCPPNGDSETNA